MKYLYLLVVTLAFILLSVDTPLHAAPPTIQRSAAPDPCAAWFQKSWQTILQTPRLAALLTDCP